MCSPSGGPGAFRSNSIAVPVRLWHGEEDNFSPAGHTLWIAGQIPAAEVEVQSGAAHFGAFEILPTMLRWLTEWRTGRATAHPPSPAGRPERVRVDDPRQQP